MRRALPWILLAAVVALVAWKLATSRFDWAGFGRSLSTANVPLLLLATLVIWANNLFRAARWSVFLRPASRAAGTPPTPWWNLIGSQFIGFAGLAIFGRIGELIRPLLVSRRTGLPFASQVAVVTVERVFDLGAFATLFSLNLVLSPGLQALPYHEKFHTVGYAIAALTAVIAGFVAAVRLAGTPVAAFIGRVVGLVSKPGGATVEEKLLAFRAGLNVLDSFADFLLAAALSLALWITIAAAYVLTLRAFPAPVNAMTIPDTLVLMGFSVVGSLVQLPGVGGGAQVGTISALTLLFSIPKELAVSAGLMVWLITSMAIVLPGLIYARVEGISIKQLARRSEAADGQVKTADGQAKAAEVQGEAPAL